MADGLTPLTIPDNLQEPNGTLEIEVTEGPGPNYTFHYMFTRAADNQVFTLDAVVQPPPQLYPGWQLNAAARTNLLAHLNQLSMQVRNNPPA